MADVIMPRLSDSMEEGTIIQWLKGEGDVVTRGEEIVEIETDKANVMYEAEDDGVLAIIAVAGQTARVGEIIARVGDDGAPASARAAPALAEIGVASTTTRRAPVDDRPDENGARRVPSSPLARRVAARLGIDVAEVEGTGVHGRVTKKDVEAAASAARVQGPPKDAEEQAGGERRREGVPASIGGLVTQELTRIQQVIAQRMAASKATVPDFSVTVDVDMEAACAARTELALLVPDGQRPPSINDLVVKACALALRRHPRANASYRDGHFELHDRINVGLAVAADNTLLVPVVHDADGKGLAQISSETLSLANRARGGMLSPAELSGGTFTVSNLGMFGVRSFTAVINLPQSAILAVGAMSPRPVVDGREIVARETMSLTLTSDHRILYGADAAAFLATVRSLLERPLSMLL